MSNYGLKASRIGFDVNTASDKQLAFSSEWPLLPIEAEGDVTIEVPAGGAGNVTQTIYTHNLGYPPVFYIHRVSGGFFWLTWGYIDDEKLWIDAYVSGDVNLKWKIFRRPIKTSFEASISDVSDATKETDEDYGLLVSLPGKDIKSTDKRDFCVRSDVRQLMIHKSGYTTTPSLGMVIDHNLGYKPMYFVYMEPGTTPGEYRFATATDGLNFNVSNTQLGFGGYFDPLPNWGYIIFKDTLTTDG